MQFAPTEQMVYRAAARLAREQPAGFDAQQLALRLGCDERQARVWLNWLRKTGDFEPVASGDAE
jgi:hypothetical protein